MSAGGFNLLLHYNSHLLLHKALLFLDTGPSLITAIHVLKRLPCINIFIIIIITNSTPIKKKILEFA